jgi:hypothetical protein
MKRLHKLFTIAIAIIVFVVLDAIIAVTVADRV